MSDPNPFIEAAGLAVPGPLVPPVAEPSSTTPVETLEERVDKLEIALASLGSITYAGGAAAGHHFLKWLEDHWHKLFQ